MPRTCRGELIVEEREPAEVPVELPETPLTTVPEEEAEEGAEGEGM